MMVERGEKMKEVNLRHSLRIIDEQFKDQRVHKFLYNDFQRQTIEPDAAFVDFLLANNKKIHTFFVQLKDKNLLDQAADNIAAKVIGFLLNHNQYFQFDQSDQQLLSKMYKTLFSLLFAPLQLDQQAFVHVLQEHYRCLRLFLVQTNPQIILTDSFETPATFCSEYSALFQSDILQLDVRSIKEPVLDIGCGENSRLTQYLYDVGFKVIGIDRLANLKHAYALRQDWFDFPYGVEKWGTIISHMAFSNHFRFHHFRDNPEATQYALLYKNILSSLQPGGQFVYTPDLPFIEEHLDTKLYIIEHYPVLDNLQATRITKRIV